MKNPIYLDNASTTPVCSESIKAMLPYFSKYYGNPSSLHSGGVLAAKAVDESRKIIAETIMAHSDEIIFTSGGTEGNNLAIFGLCNSQTNKGHIITVATEHDSVLEPINVLKNDGWRVSFAKIDNQGRVDVESLIKMISEDTVLISVMYANNEIGTIQPIAELGRAILHYRKERNSKFPVFHTDACQAPSYLELNVEKMHVDLMTINSGKIYGPKGIGALFVKRGIELKPLIVGGGQEKGLRSGTENVPLVVGFSKALGIAARLRKKEVERLEKLSSYFLTKIQTFFPNIILNGPEIGKGRLANNININFPGLDGEQTVLYLDSMGVKCSTASACSSVTNEPSHVLKAIGLRDDQNRSSVRFSMGRLTKKSDLDKTVQFLEKIKYLFI